MSEQELIDAIVSMTLQVGTKYSEQELRDLLESKASEEIETIYVRAKKRFEELHHSSSKIQDLVEEGA